MMGKTVVAAIFGALVGGLAIVGVMAMFSGWGLPTGSQMANMEPTRSDYVDLLLTLVTIFLGAIGLAVTLGALVIGMIALITLPRIRAEAANHAVDAAGRKIDEILQEDETLHNALTKLVREGELDDVLGRLLTRLQGGPETVNPENLDDEND